MSVRMSGHYLDWANKPSPFKVYKGLPSVQLPHDFPHPKGDPLRCLTNTVPKTQRRTLDIRALAELLFFSAGITRKMKIGPDFYYMRAASATGALYPIELYVVSGDIPGLGAGVYHFNPLEFTLVRIRDGDWRLALGEACGWEAVGSPVSILFTSLAWRNAWKYEARSYRHWFWDSGVMVANLLATANSEGFPIGVRVGFVDSKVDRLLGLEEGKEAAVAVVPLVMHIPEPPKGEESKVVPELSPECEPLSKGQTEYPSIWRANEATSLATLGDVGTWRGSFKPQERSKAGGGPSFPLDVSGEQDRPPSTLAETVLHRGSTRRFARESISLAQLSSILDASSAEAPLDFLLPGVSLIDFYLIAKAVRGLPPGSYFFDRYRRSFAQLKLGQFIIMSS
jgi:SagB-type dehydrogenase family enzyme